MTPTEDLDRIDRHGAPTPHLTPAVDADLLTQLRTGYADMCARLRHVLDTQDAAASGMPAPAAGHFAAHPAVIDLVRSTLTRHERHLADLTATDQPAPVQQIPSPTRARSWAWAPDRRSPIPGEWLG